MSVFREEVTRSSALMAGSTHTFPRIHGAQLAVEHFQVIEEAAKDAIAEMQSQIQAEQSRCRHENAALLEKMELFYLADSESFLQIGQSPGICRECGLTPLFCCPRCANTGVAGLEPSLVEKPQNAFSVVISSEQLWRLAGYTSLPTAAESYRLTAYLCLVCDLRWHNAVTTRDDG